MIRVCLSHQLGVTIRPDAQPSESLVSQVVIHEVAPAQSLRGDGAMLRATPTGTIAVCLNEAVQPRQHRTNLAYANSKLIYVR